MGFLAHAQTSNHLTDVTVAECLADLMMLAHACFSLFLVLGLLMIMAGMVLDWRWTRSRTFRFLHLTATMLVVVRVLIGIPCPLSTIENNFRDRTIARCPFGQPIHEALHRISFRGTDTHQFARSSTLFGLVVVVAFALNRDGVRQLCLNRMRSVPLLRTR